MKIKTFKSCFYCMVFICIPCTAQFTDDFNDDDFRRNPAWLGDTTHFEVNGSHQLHLIAPAVSGNSYLSTSSDVYADAIWKFWIQLDFNPSSGNYAKVYLMADRSKLDSSLNGYYLRIGGTDDDISLFRQDGTTSKILIDGRNGMLNKTVNKLSLRVTRSIQGEWIISCDSSGFVDFEELGSFRDTSYWISRFFGIQCIYTLSRTNKFLFDNFYVSGKRSTDTIPPFVKEAYAIDDSVILIRFSEAIGNNSITNPSNYKLPFGTTINKFQVDDDLSVKLYLSKNITCKQKLEFSVSGFRDLSNNVMGRADFSVSFCPGVIHNVLITEIMADPDPAVLLPDVEYLELFNVGGVALNIEKWKLQIGSSQITLPSFNLPADSFLIICTKKGCSGFANNKYCLDLLSSWSLNNTGEYVGLKNRNGNLIHWVGYDESFYRDDLKKSGGWALELIDINQPCLGKENWKASNSIQGGTPGKANSVFGTVTDSREFQFEHIFLPNDSTIRLYFTEPINSASFSKSIFVLDHGFGSPASILTDSLQNVWVDLIYRRKFQPNSLYNLSITEDITACSGNKVFGFSPSFMKPKAPVAGDVIINEILFDALPGGHEFIEFYNKSDKFINSNDLKIAYRSISSGYNSTFELGNYPFIIAPHKFVVAVKSSDGMKEFYHIPDISSIITCKSFSSLSNEEGCVTLMNKSLEKLDEFCYSEKMHFSLLVNKSGVSLERIRYENPISDAGNWHSASSTEGFATPGAQNSQFLESGEIEEEITIEHEIFSPDNDGFKDVETIFYALDQPGFVASIVVFDALGRRVRILANNKTLGIQGQFTWDGIDEKGRLAQTGIYLIYIELHHPSGEVKQYRKTCVLGAGH